MQFVPSTKSLWQFIWKPLRRKFRQTSPLVSSLYSLMRYNRRMKNLILTLSFAAGLLLIWVGDLRLMLTGLFLTIDAIGAQIYFNSQTFNENLGLVGNDMLTINGAIIKRLDAIEESLQNLKEKVESLKE